MNDIKGHHRLDNPISKGLTALIGLHDFFSASRFCLTNNLHEITVIRSNICSTGSCVFHNLLHQYGVKPIFAELQTGSSLTVLLFELFIRPLLFIINSSVPSIIVVFIRVGDFKF